MQKLVNWLAQNQKPAAAPAVPLTRLLERVQQLPPLPDVALRAMSLANDPDSALSDYVGLIKRDASLAAAVLKLANSVLYCSNQPTANLLHAVLRLGLRTCTNLVTTMGMRGMFKQMPPPVQLACEELVHHSVLTAFLAGGFNESLRLGHQGEEFSGGLLHDVGRLVLAVASADLFTAVNPPGPVDPPDVVALEEQALGTNHAAIGVEYGAKNRFPGPVLNCVKYHHKPAQASADGPLVHLITTCDHIAQHTHCDGSLETYRLEDNPGFPLLAAGWDVRRQNDFRDVLPVIVGQAFEQATELMKAQQNEAGDRP